MSRKDRTDGCYQKVDKRCSFRANVGSGKPSKYFMVAPDGTKVNCDKVYPLRHNMVRRDPDGTEETLTRRHYKAIRAAMKAVRRAQHKTTTKG